MVLDLQMEKATTAVLAFCWFPKHTMLFHTVGPLLLLLLLIPQQSLGLSMAQSNTSSKSFPHRPTIVGFPPISSYHSIFFHSTHHNLYSPIY